MMHSSSTHSRLSANHTDKQVILHVLANAQISNVSDIKTAIIFIKF